eukprot:6910521-Prymnesium_polylepis.1
MRPPQEAGTHGLRPWCEDILSSSSSSSVRIAKETYPVYTRYKYKRLQDATTPATGPAASTTTSSVQ